MSVLLQTSLGMCYSDLEASPYTKFYSGSVVIDLFVKEAPEESINFIKLCKAKYYQFAPFYNIQKGYHASLGNPNYPLQKEGMSAWRFAGSKSVFKTNMNRLYHNKIGRVSYITQSDVNDPNSYYASSLINITLDEFDEKRTNVSRNVVFGQVAEGFDVLEQINYAILDEQHNPLKDIRVHHIVILDDPFEDIENLYIPASTPEPTQEQISTIRLEEVERIDLESVTEIEDEIKRRKQEDAGAKALTLEIIGDLPSAEIKPMENVLFVCKLNPVTKSDDLEIIFARFGKIISCEVVKDFETAQSLQYAFIEYEDKKCCEAAYFKMDGALIDDRRICVDFSQSVSKLADTWRSKTNEKRKENHVSTLSDNGRGSSKGDDKERERPSPRTEYRRDDRNYNDRERSNRYYDDKKLYSRYDDGRKKNNRDYRDSDKYRSADRHTYRDRSPERSDHCTSHSSRLHNSNDSQLLKLPRSDNTNTSKPFSDL